MAAAVIWRCGDDLAVALVVVVRGQPPQSSGIQDVCPDYRVTVTSVRCSRSAIRCPPQCSRL